MEILRTGIEGLLQLQPTVWSDTRGWFMEFYRSSSFEEFTAGNQFDQDNISYSKKNVLRGLHLQLPPFAQAKIITVLSGRVVDVVVDLRTSSPTFGKVYSCELDSTKRNLLLVPEGFAHGFSALEDTLFFYKCSHEFNAKYETGIRWNDQDLNIDWKVADPILSDKDKLLPSLHDLLVNSVISR